MVASFPLQAPGEPDCQRQRNLCERKSYPECHRLQHELLGSVPTADEHNLQLLHRLPVRHGGWQPGHRRQGHATGPPNRRV